MKRSSPWPTLGLTFSLICLGVLAVASLESSRGAAVTPSRDAVVPSPRSAAVPSVRPLSRELEPGWLRRHRRISADARKGGVDLLFLGDSITQGWGDNSTWHRYYAKRRALNAGIASDRVEHILWRTRNGNLDGITPKVVVLLAGVNNLAVTTPTAIAAGSAAVIDEIMRHSQGTKILLLGVFPSGRSPTNPRRAKIRRLNHELAKLGHRPGVTYLDIGHRFLEPDGSLSKSVMFDYLHLTPRGYAIWAQAMEPTLSKLLDETRS